MKLILIIILSVLHILIISGCSSQQVNSQQEQIAQISSESPFGELSNQIGDNNEVELSKSLDLYDSDVLWQHTEYNEQSGRWFLDDSSGKLGFSMTRGKREPKSEVTAALQPHPEKEIVLERQVRIQLTKRDEDLKKMKLIEESVIDIQDIIERQIVFSGNLPDDEDAIYLLSMEIIDENLTVEDTIVASIYVVSKKINVQMSAEQTNFSVNSSMKLTIQNNGPINVYFGEYYIIEKFIDSKWWMLELDRQFRDIGIILESGDTNYSEVISLRGLEVGKYRIIKSIQSQETDEQHELAIEFTIS